VLHVLIAVGKITHGEDEISIEIIKAEGQWIISGFTEF
jgi:hypothetical protein